MDAGALRLAACVAGWRPPPMHVPQVAGGRPPDAAGLGRCLAFAAALDVDPRRRDLWPLAPVTWRRR